MLLKTMKNTIAVTTVRQIKLNENIDLYRRMRGRHLSIDIHITLVTIFQDLIITPEESESTTTMKITVMSQHKCDPRQMLSPSVVLTIYQQVVVLYPVLVQAVLPRHHRPRRPTL